jgi:hypothetical protein
LSFEAGTSTRECFAAMALRIRVNISAMGSVMKSNSSYLIVDCRLPIADLKNFSMCSIGNWQLQIGNVLTS